VPSAWVETLPLSRTDAARRALVPGGYLLLGLASGIAWILARDWTAALALWVLWAGWRWLKTAENPPVLAAAFTFQWIQITIGLYYYALTGVRLPAIDLSQYRPMVLIGLGCLVALMVGLRLGMKLVRAPRPVGAGEPARIFGWRPLIAIYLASVAVTGAVQEFAWEVPALTQGILALTYARFALLFLIFRRLSRPRIRLGWIAVLLAGETILGFTGYFAGFREPMMMAVVALAGAFDRRKAQHWLVLGLLGVVMVLTGVLWMGIRTEYRRDFENHVFARSREARLEQVAALSSNWLQRRPVEMVSDVEFFVDRLWAVYYPALAVARVPAVVPHEEGALLWGAVVHTLTPRLLFPDKPAVESDSEKVRRYAGVWVPGPEENTSIAFGYAAESYVDFGLPLMFVPVLLYGVLMGIAYHALLRLIRNRELAIALVAVVLWLSLYLFERSWPNLLGLSLTLIAYLGGATLLFDRLLLWKRPTRPLLRRSSPESRSARPGFGTG
jgi:hypothetical protein